MTARRDDVVQQWVTSMRAEGHSEKSIRRRVCTVRHIERDTGKKLEDLNTDRIAAWLAQYPGAYTRYAYYGDFGAFFSWMQRTGRFTLVSPLAQLKRPKQPKGKPRPLSTDLVLEGRLKAPPDLRALITLGAYQGLRIGEAVSVRGENISGGMIRVIGKGANCRGPSDCTIPAHPLVQELAATYPRRGYWFPGLKPGTHRDSSHYGSVIRDWYAEELDARMVFHQFRHWCGTAMLAAGADLRFVQEYLRHESPTSTARYTQVSNDQLAAAAMLLPGSTPLAGAA